MALNVANHEKEVADLKNQVAQGTDADVRALAANTVPILSAHLELASRINGTINPAAFLASALQDSIAEIQLSQLALRKTSNSDVRNFAQRMINDHTQINNQITQLAQQKNVILSDEPSAEQKMTFDQLLALSGAAFDKAYMDANVTNHQKDVNEFTDQSVQTTVADISAFAVNTLPILSAHLVVAREINSNLQSSSQ